MSDHYAEHVFNAGWDDDPNWKVICSCGWEAWNYPSEARVLLSHERHVAAVSAGEEGGALRGEGEQ